ncbi:MULTISPECIES: RNA-binding cell elongation regulator Jag/EloR [Bacillus amyloliquefaciens group]|uniref:RNA-binding cell elongation regulator Jag/EloR n=1 Tax=Bacillus amyloliquefaciens group TaxID=1938374 RepID=UPI00158076BB|nr:RNA-binding cell elongation regulator Jag/EloR [Bacillus velezensis]NUI22756.1 protein jag [Bacillus amyloliquefaciens]NUI31520.1 protein jag [Bacillus amyloliquefaciens]NUI35449.1 protein jag [Bacillus amyloliquefaciens]NUI69296.1 protein jag [Bacillus amyloliquefaciens]NUI72505.1 protein jag [Bacillus amyloliquefaciens]
MKKVTAAGRNVEEAVQSGLQELQLTKDQVEITVVQEEYKGFLGIFGKKNAIVELEEKRNPVQEAKAYLEEIIHSIAGPSEIVTEENKKTVCFHIKGEKAALLIGKRGQTLNALETLTQLVLNRGSGQYHQAVVDAENYRRKRREILDQLANRLAKQVSKTKKDVHLEPMPSGERKIIHDALSKHPNIKTFSTGEGRYRHLVISHKDSRKPKSG